MLITATHHTMLYIITQAQEQAPAITQPHIALALIISAIGCVTTLSSFFVGKKKQRMDEKRLSEAQRNQDLTAARELHLAKDAEIGKYMTLRMRMMQSEEYAEFLERFDEEWERNKSLRDLMNRF